jgi:hypothetical protein
LELRAYQKVLGPTVFLLIGSTVIRTDSGDYRSIVTFYTTIIDFSDMLKKTTRITTYTSDETEPGFYIRLVV